MLIILKFFFVILYGKYLLFFYSLYFHIALYLNSLFNLYLIFFHIKFLLFFKEYNLLKFSILNFAIINI